MRIRRLTVTYVGNQSKSQERRRGRSRSRDKGGRGRSRDRQQAPSPPPVGRGMLVMLVSVWGCHRCYSIPTHTLTVMVVFRLYSSYPLIVMSDWVALSSLWYTMYVCMSGWLDVSRPVDAAAARPTDEVRRAVVMVAVVV